MSRLLRRDGTPPVPTRELTVRSADGARIHVEVHGRDGAPAVVLAHGWTCSTRFWDAQIRDLAADHRVVVYDQRGHGASPAVDRAGCSTDALADDLEAVLAATLEPGERAVLGGHSMGGMTIMAAARRDGLREHAAAVLLCSTGSSRLPAESVVVPMRAGAVRTRATRAILVASAPLGPVTPITRRVLKYATMGAGSAPERVETCARIVHACPRKARAAWGRVLADLDLDAGVRELRVPTAVIAGTADRLTPIGHARAIAAALPDGLGLTELTGLGHMTPVEAPEAVTAKLRELVTAYLPAGADAGAGAGAKTHASASASAGTGTDGTATAEKEEVA
ncbi:alpha/beta fold hydrolase [Streptomyces sp. NBC_00893]|uniref:alpha/beta fold hydrolase n=1 Tax=Streptomyces sp. NBC_00893 TaxID=2975862 RepID=UPI0022593364|nr:alpha/beta fold hydrolase [Streptomyces sp. NBC_00893]MCX4847432.1 alpha/beta hydrolase [Streptomyces sp. NBC_00893]